MATKKHTLWEVADITGRNAGLEGRDAACVRLAAQTTQDAIDALKSGDVTRAMLQLRVAGEFASEAHRALLRMEYV